MNTTHVKDRAERKKLKRAARKKAPGAKPRPDDVPRGSRKRKVVKLAKGQVKR